MNKAYITIDLDWASEAVIGEALKIVADANVPITFFQTHKSERVLLYCQNHLSSLEWHPNFMLGSSHGGSVKEIANSLKNIPAEKRIVRCHLYHAPEPAFGSFMNMTGITVTSNVLSLLKPLPIRVEENCIEMPVFFEDGAFIKAGLPFDVNVVMNAAKNADNLVFVFHPIHLAFNSFDYQLTRTLKDQLSRQEYRSIDKNIIDERRYCGYGIANLFIDLVKALKMHDSRCCLMKEAFDND